MTDDAGTHKAHGVLRGVRRRTSPTTEARPRSSPARSSCPRARRLFTVSRPETTAGASWAARRATVSGISSRTAFRKQGYTEQLRYDDRGSLFGEGGQGDRPGRLSRRGRLGRSVRQGPAGNDDLHLPRRPSAPAVTGVRHGPGLGAASRRRRSRRLRGHRASRPSRAAHGHDGRSRPGDRTPGLDAGGFGTYFLTRPASSSHDPSFDLGKAPSGSNVRPPESIAGVAAKVLPSVVSLTVEGGTSASTGSGFLIKGGYVVTNNHVVAGAASGRPDQIQIQFNNRKSTPGRVVGVDPESDLAVVKPEETFGAPEITLGNSDNVVVGDPVIAIGSPLGLTGTVTSGIVSSLNRPVQAGEENSSDTTWLSAVQTDAAINPGNSGGRWSTPTARSSASTRRSPPSAGRSAARAAASGSDSPSR